MLTLQQTQVVMASWLAGLTMFETLNALATLGLDSYAANTQWAIIQIRYELNERYRSACLSVGVGILEE